MRCINTSTLQVQSCESRQMASQYAILSHIWEPEDATFDLLCPKRDISLLPGLAKLKSACLKAHSYGIKWLWATNSCIDRSSSAELNESINSSSKIFKNSAMCLVYLHDLDIDEEPPSGWESVLKACRWMRRAWTLHELIFSGRIEFYNRKWVMIGTKESLLSPLSAITGIDKSVLTDPQCLGDFSIGYKMSWAAHSIPTAIEDMAYSLIGIFRVSLLVCYGEGQMAFLRLQHEIAKSTDDGTLLAWRSNNHQQYRGFFATCPSEFSFMSYSCKMPLRIKERMRITNAGLCINDTFTTYKQGEGIILSMWPNQNQYGIQGLGVIFKEQNGRFMRYMPHHTLDMYRAPGGPRRDICLDNGLQQNMLQHISTPLNLLRLKPDRANYPMGFSPPHPCNVGDVGHHPAGSFRSLPPSSRMGQCFAGYTKPNPDVLHARNNHLERYINCNQKSTTGFTCFNAAQPKAAPDNQQILDHSSDNRSDYDYEYDDENYMLDEDEEGSEYSSCESDTISNSSEQFEKDVLEAEIPTISHEDNFAKFIAPLKTLGLETFSAWVTETQTLGKRARDEETSDQLQKRRKCKLPVEQLSIDYTTDSEDEDTAIIQTRSYHVAFFACPFYLQNPVRHRSCLKMANLLSIRDVIIHIRSAHRQPYYCPICGALFEKGIERDTHIIRRTCSRGVVPNVHGALYSQIERISHDLSPLHTKEVQWYAIWDILFPKKKQPRQPYLSGKVDYTVCRLKDFWSVNGPEIVADFIKDREIQELVTEKTNTDVICASVLVQMIDAIIA